MNLVQFKEQLKIAMNKAAVRHVNQSASQLYETFAPTSGFDPEFSARMVTEGFEESDPHGVTELHLHSDNTEHLYRHKHAIRVNLAKKAKKGVYDPEKAKKLWSYHADEVAKDYHKTHGSPGTKWNHMFSTGTRKQFAHELEHHNREEIHTHADTLSKGEYV